MTPYYRDALVTLYHGLAEEWLNDEVLADADVVVTDPPYDTNGRGIVAWLVAERQDVAAFGWPEDLVTIARTANRTPDDWIVWWPTNAVLRRGSPRGHTPREAEHIAIWGEVRWVHGAATTRNGDALVLKDYQSKGRRGSYHRAPQGKKFGDVWTDPSPGLAFQSSARLHPNEKPVPIMQRLLQVVPDGVVLDPFAGSGSTLVAAKSLGRHAIGIEREEKHCETAATRCSQEILGLGA